MVLSFAVAISLLIMLLQGFDGFIAPTVSGNVVFSSLLLVQISAVFLQLMFWYREQKENHILEKIFLYGAGCGVLWSSCIGYSERVEVPDITSLRIATVTMVSFICGAMCLLIANFFRRR